MSVLIVGAGPVGLCLAYSLAENGVNPKMIKIISLPDEGEYSRAFGIWPRTLELVHTLSGVGESFLERGIKFDFNAADIIKGKCESKEFLAGRSEAEQLEAEQLEAEQLEAEQLEDQGNKISLLETASEELSFITKNQRMFHLELLNSKFNFPLSLGQSDQRDIFKEMLKSKYDIQVDYDSQLSRETGRVEMVYEKIRNNEGCPDNRVIGVDVTFETTRPQTISDNSSEMGSSQVLSSSHQSVSTEKRLATERFDFVCGCDGAHSAVRKLCNFNFPGHQQKRSMWLLDAYMKSKMLKIDSTLWTSTESGRAVIFFPLRRGKGEHEGSDLFRAVTLAEEGDHEVPTLEKFKNLIASTQLKHDRSFEILEPVVWMTCHRPHFRIVDEYFNKRVVLAGDAAHVHSPMGGQGVNLGIGDAINLGWKLSLLLKIHRNVHGKFKNSTSLGLEPGSLDYHKANQVSDLILHSYQTERRYVGAMLVKSIAKMSALMENTFFEKYRTKVVGFVPFKKFFNRRMACILAQFHWTYSPNIFVQGQIQTVNSRHQEEIAKEPEGLLHDGYYQEIKRDASSCQTALSRPPVGGLDLKFWFRLLLGLVSFIYSLCLNLKNSIQSAIIDNTNHFKTRVLSTCISSDCYPQIGRRLINFEVASAKDLGNKQKDTNKGSSSPSHSPSPSPSPSRTDFSITLTEYRSIYSVLKPLRWSLLYFPKIGDEKSNQETIASFKALTFSRCYDLYVVGNAYGHLHRHQQQYKAINTQQQQMRDQRTKEDKSNDENNLDDCPDDCPDDCQVIRLVAESPKARKLILRGSEESACLLVRPDLTLAHFQIPASPQLLNTFFQPIADIIELAV